MTDTGSEFALTMSKLIADLAKDSSSVLKEVMILMYQNKAAREQMLLSSNDFESMVKTKSLDNLDAITISKELLLEFERIAKQKELAYSAMNINDENVALIYDKDQIELLNQLIKAVEEEKLKEMGKEKDGIQSNIENIKNNTHDDSSKENISQSKDKSVDVER